VAEAVELDAAEIQSLRQEITTRIGLMQAIVAVELAALGTGLTILHDYAHVLAGLAAISSFLWLLWLDQSLSTYKIAAYLAIEVAPRMQQITARRTLGWEAFLRRVESGGQESVHALYQGALPPSGGIVRSVRADWYVPLLFGASPPILLTLYVRASSNIESSLLLIGLASLIGGLFWLFAISRFIDFVRNAKVIDKAILAADAEFRGQPEI
jgi:hypothetical protein